MAEPHQQSHGSEPTETPDRGILDCIGKKEEKPQEDAAMKDLEKTKEHKHTLVEELHQTNSNSIWSSDEAEEVGGKKKRKKKGLKEMIEGKMSREDVEVSQHKDASDLPDQVQKVNAEPAHHEEKKGFLEKLKVKLPGQHKKSEEGSPAAPPECAADGNSPAEEAKEKKGIMEKIKEKLPGYRKNDGEEVKKEN
ncbi:hypothetical protein NMG60_11019372 [Bertholletia excelsa]